MRRKSSRSRHSSRQTSPQLGFEQLEIRRVLTAWHNDASPFDVNDQNGVGPLDALLVVNELNDRVYSSPVDGKLPDSRPADAPFLDVRNDGVVAPLDALLVINELGPATEPNKFTISDNVTDGFLIGNVMPSGGTSSDSIFEFAKSDTIPASIRDILQLKPGDHLNGAADAPVVMIEYVDFACPICGLYHPLFQQALQAFEGEIAVVTRHLPLTEIHPNAPAAAVAAEAAGRQGMFDEMADLLFTRRSSTGWDASGTPNTFFRQFAQELGLNMTQFEADLADPALAELVANGRTEANSGLGFTGTPSLVLNDFVESNPGISQPAVNQMFQNAIDAIDTPFKIDRYTGAIRVRDASLLNASTTPSYTLDVMVNGQVETITIDVT